MCPYFSDPQKEIVGAEEVAMQQAQAPNIFVLRVEDQPEDQPTDERTWQERLEEALWAAEPRWQHHPELTGPGFSGGC